MVDDLSYLPFGTGSLPHTNPQDAMCLVERIFKQVPYWAQLPILNRLERLTTQFTEGFPGICQNSSFVYVDNNRLQKEKDILFEDYENALRNGEISEKYSLNEPFSSTFPLFLNLVEKNRYKFSKGQITGVFTSGFTMRTNEAKPLLFDKNNIEVLIKFLTLKAFWQIKKIKEASPSTIPLIFLDEPGLNHSLFLKKFDISDEEVINALNTVCENIKNFGAIAGIHYCGEKNGEIILKTDFDIVNFDVISLEEKFYETADGIEKFIQNGGKFAWGIVPSKTVDINKFNSPEKLFEKFLNIANNANFSNKGMIFENSLVTSSCGLCYTDEKTSEKMSEYIVKISQMLKQEVKK